MVTRHTILYYTLTRNQHGHVTNRLSVSVSDWDELAIASD